MLVSDMIEGRRVM